MKLRAIRVAEVGRFETPMALEGLSGGLDLVVAPNEAGKSTLVKAARAALFKNHRTTADDIAKLRPYRGGAPLIEVEVEIGHEIWRIRKRFLAEKMAEVTSLTSGRKARGSDAEALIEQLLGPGEGGGRIGMLWLGQGAALAPTPPGEAGAAMLRGAIESEIVSAAGAGVSRHVRSRVKEALSGMVTAARGTPRGRYAAATSAVQTAEADLASAQREHAEVEAQLAQLAQLQLAARDDSDHGGRPQLLARLAASEAALKAARDAVAGRDRARLVASETRARETEATGAAKALAQAMTDVASLEQAARDEAEATAPTLSELTRITMHHTALVGSLAEAKSAVAQAAARLKAAEIAARRHELSGRLQRAETLVAEADRLRGLLGEGGPDEPTVRLARRLAGQIGEAAARLEAAAPTVAIDYAPDSAQRVHVDGAAVADGARLIAVVPLMLEIAGVGRITVSPGASADAGRLTAKRDADAEALDALLATAGVPDVAALETRHDTARTLASELAQIDAELRALAPKGVAMLASAVSELDREAHAGGASVSPAHATDDGAETASEGAAFSLDRLAEALTRSTDDLAVLERDLAAADAQRDDLRQQEAAIIATAAERRRRLTVLAATLPPPEAIERERLDREAAADQARRDHDDALRMLAAWDRDALDQAGLARLERDVVDVRDHLQRAADETARRAAEQHRLEGALQAAQREDIASRVAQLEAEVERVRAVLADVTEEVAALQLLDAELAHEEENLKERYLAPVHARLAPLQDIVFPGGQIALDEGYRVAGLVRDGQSEDVARLSDGTREQIAVLVRLGFARLLADQGLGVPLILDDALVYSDDDRITLMHRALEEAAMAHQVLVLTCREQAFVGLRGHRVTLAPWREALVAV